MDVYEVKFSGAILRRGFWIYVWMIETSGGRRLAYVGRTGDTSSPNAQSPFRRIGQHVDPNPKSKSNALSRNLKEIGINPETCEYSFTALGPICAECQDMESHIPIRDKAAALERKTADWFARNKIKVLGSHPRSRDVDDEAWREIEYELARRFNPTLVPRAADGCR